MNDCVNFQSYQCQELNYQFWNQSNTIRENYIEKVSYSGYFSGNKEIFSCVILQDELNHVIIKLRDGIQRSLLTQQNFMNIKNLDEVISPTYFYYEVKSIQYLNSTIGIDSIDFISFFISL